MKIDRNSIIKEIIEEHPYTYEVFKRNRLVLAGGVRGPNEPLAFFCKAHNVDYNTLVKELEEAIAKGPPSGEVLPPPLAEDTIYAIYAKAALIVCLTVGCTFGAAVLAYIALNKDYYVMPVSLIQAHGHAQLFGWVGLFIMGFAYYIVPRVKNIDLQGRGITYLSFWAMLTGLVLRTVLQAVPDTSLAILLPLSGVLQLFAALVFTLVLLKTFKASQEGSEIFDKFFVAGLIWFIAACGLNLYLDVYLYQHATGEIPAALHHNLVHIFLFGFVFMFIFGVNLRTVFAFLDVREPNTPVINFCFWLLNAVVALYLIQSLSSWLVYPLATGVLLFTYGIRVFESPTKELADIVMDRSYEKTIKAAYVWLIIGMLIRVAVPSIGESTPAGHLFYGASNHAVTVGFVSMMMIGYASKMVPTFRGVALYNMRLSEWTFLLLNAGIFLRVFSQMLIPFYPGLAYPVVGISGWVEVTALGMFAYNLWNTINMKEELRAEERAKRLSFITKDTIVYDAIESCPETLEVFLDFGFSQLSSPTARRTMAKVVTVEAACKFKSVDLDKLLEALNNKIKEKRTT
ncbi:MAG: DUF1858 domain-containing protein [Candidatus Brocadiales bacterium]|nr:DUF1858 domain-containing protein [Candidatus Bathyanammoxibius sp.]MCQ4575101.1 DUF1858 domain-containing protein [Candidatus Bathyanammoxibius amoris]